MEPHRREAAVKDLSSPTAMKVLESKCLGAFVIIYFLVSLANRRSLFFP